MPAGQPLLLWQLVRPRAVRSGHPPPLLLRLKAHGHRMRDARVDQWALHQARASEPVQLGLNHATGRRHRDIARTCRLLKIRSYCACSATSLRACAHQLLFRSRAAGRPALFNTHSASAVSRTCSSRVRSPSSCSPSSSRSAASLAAASCSHLGAALRPESHNLSWGCKHAAESPKGRVVGGGRRGRGGVQAAQPGWQQCHSGSP
jgi:hypothetical protein